MINSAIALLGAISLSHLFQGGHEVTPGYPQLKIFIDDNIDAVRNACDGVANATVEVQNLTVLCIFGEIEFRDEYGAAERDYPIAYANTPGGDAALAMSVGREIHRNGAVLIVDVQCSSACANYIVPAARRLYITDRSFISMHGSFPRSPRDYSTMIANARLPNRAEADPVELARAVGEAVADYPEYFETEVLEESRFFARLRRAEAYITRYFEVSRALSHRENYSCRPPEGLQIIVGPQYLDEFHIRALRVWFPVSPVAYVELLPRSSEHFTLVFDFDEDPFWLSGRGLVTRETCYGDQPQSLGQQ